MRHWVAAVGDQGCPVGGMSPWQGPAVSSASVRHRVSLSSVVTWVTLMCSLLMLEEQGSKQTSLSLYTLLSPRNLGLPSFPSPQPALLLQSYSQFLLGSCPSIPLVLPGHCCPALLHSPSSTGETWQVPEQPRYKPRTEKNQRKITVAEPCLIGNG